MRYNAMTMLELTCEPLPNGRENIEHSFWQGKKKRKRKETLKCQFCFGTKLHHINKQIDGSNHHNQTFLAAK